MSFVYHLRFTHVFSRVTHFFTGKKNIFKYYEISFVLHFELSFMIIPVYSLICIHIPIEVNFFLNVLLSICEKHQDLRKLVFEMKP